MNKDLCQVFEKCCMFHEKTFISKPQNTNVMVSSFCITSDSFIVLSKAKGEVLGPIQTLVDESLSKYIPSNGL